LGHCSHVIFNRGYFIKQLLCYSVELLSGYFALDLGLEMPNPPFNRLISLMEALGFLTAPRIVSGRRLPYYALTATLVEAKAQQHHRCTHKSGKHVTRKIHSKS